MRSTCRVISEAVQSRGRLLDAELIQQAFSGRDLCVKLPPRESSSPGCGCLGRVEAFVSGSLEDLVVKRGQA